MLIVMFSGSYVFSALGTAGLVGILAWLGIIHLQQTGTIAYSQGTNYNQVILPMFVMMSEFLSRGHIAEDIFAVLNRSIGKFKGGLAIATTLACTIFAALCGSSPATAASIGRISIQEMTKRGYAPSFAVGTVAASGTLGIMIPPSITFCFFGILTETSIVQLLMSGILPGIILALMIISFIIIRVRINPKLINCSTGSVAELKNADGIDFKIAREIADTAKKQALAEVDKSDVAKPEKHPEKKEVGFLTILPALILIFVVLGSMYFGFATPMEAAGYGVIGAFAIILLQKRITKKMFAEVLSGTARTGAMMVFLIMCGYILTYCVSYLGVAQGISDAITKSGLNKYVVLLLLYVLWFILGCLMDPSSVVILTVPFLFKPLVDLGFNPLWIGVVTVLASQIGMITPPIGMNLFVLKANTDLQMKDIISGSLPYVILLLVAMALFTIVPEIATILPSLMF
jgi:TRAP-type C4-dicarboxylate transport system permease large subunit